MEDEASSGAMRSDARDGGYTEEMSQGGMRRQHSLHHHYHLDMNPSIYSALVYAPGILRISSGKSLNWPMMRVCSMIALNMVLQIGLLRIMFIYGHRDYQQTQYFTMDQEAVNHSDAKSYAKFLANTEKNSSSWAHLFTPDEREVLDKADADRSPMCTLDVKGDYTCQPSSMRFASEWNSLDVDKDGIWRKGEVMPRKDSTRKMKKHKVSGKTLSVESDAMETRHAIFFSSIIAGLKQRAAWMHELNMTFYLSEDVQTGRGIPKAYFDYWVGDAMLCTRLDSSTCNNVVALGLFDPALAKGKVAASHKGIFDYSSAIRYCKMMLDERGGCEQSLPASYEAAVVERKTACGTLSLKGAGVMTNPDDHNEVIQVLEPSYFNIERQKSAAHTTFVFFQIIIIYLFYASVVNEIRDLIHTSEFIMNFPSTNDEKDPGGVDLGADTEKRYVVQRISRGHRMTLAVVLFLRVGILVVLIGFGTWFLQKQLSYMELVLNAVALVFITGIDEMMYDIFLEGSDKEELGVDAAEKITFQGFIKQGSWLGTAFRKDLWGLVLVPILATCVVLWNLHCVREPIIHALSCSCLQEGPHCMESVANQQSWWTHYWTHTLPAAIHQIEALRLQGS